MAGSKSNGFETDILELIFTNTTLAGIGDSTGLVGSGTAGSLYIALMEVIPADASDGLETTYTNYVRVAVARTVGGWTVSSGACSNTAAITFAQCGATGATLRGFGICKADVEGVDDLIYWGELTSPLAVSSGITPEFAIGDLDVTED